MSIPFNTRQWAEGVLPARQVPVDKVVSTQVHLDQVKVGRMAKKRTGSLPTPVVAQVGDRYLVGDGHHRVAAAKKKGERFIKARVVT